MPHRLDRRAWLKLLALSAVAVPSRRIRAQSAPATNREARIRSLIHAFEEQGFHRTATSVDRASANWLRDEVRKAGLTASLESFQLRRVDVQSAAVTIGDRRVEGIPLFDGGFTDEHGVRGRVGALGTDAEIGLAETATNAAGAGPLGEARRANRHRAIICITRGGEAGLCPSNADAFLQPFGPPVLQVSSELGSWLQQQAQQRAEAHVVALVRRTSAEAVNVTANISGTDGSLPPLVIMTPRSGWYCCASERGGGIVCWLELIRAMAQAKPARDIHFVASSGHELGHLGINAFVDRRPGIVSNSVGWIHLGANIGAARIPARQARAAATTTADAPPAATWRGSGSRSSGRRTLCIDHWQQRDVSQPTGSWT